MEDEVTLEEKEDVRCQNSFDVLGSRSLEEESVVPEGNTANLTKNWEQPRVDNVNIHSAVNGMLHVNQNLKVSVEEAKGDKSPASDMKNDSGCNGEFGWKNINPDTDFVKGQGFDFLRKLEQERGNGGPMKPVRNMPSEKQNGDQGKEEIKVADMEANIGSKGKDTDSTQVAKETKGKVNDQNKGNGSRVNNHINTEPSILGEGSNGTSGNIDEEMPQAEETKVNGNQEKSYKGVLNGGIRKGKLQVKFFPSPVGQENAPAELPIENLKNASLPFMTTLYGYVLDKRVSFPVLSKEVKRLWSPAGLVDVFMNNQRFIFFKFSNEQGLNQVLENSPWLLFNNVPIFIQRWRPGLALTRNSHDKIPVWIKIYDLPLEAWSGENLCIIASKVGVPLAFDSFTEDMCINHQGRSAYARILVEMSADKEWRDKVDVKSWDFVYGVATVQSCGIEYSWKPSRCSKCKVFDHNDKSCPILAAKKNEEAETKKEEGMKKKRVDKGVDEDGFTLVQKKGSIDDQHKASTSGTKEGQNGYSNGSQQRTNNQTNNGRNGNNNASKIYGGWNGKNKNGGWKQHGGNQNHKGNYNNDNGKQGGGTRGLTSGRQLIVNRIMVRIKGLSWMELIF